MWFIKQKTWTFTYSHNGGKEKTTKTLNKMCETIVLDIQQQAEQDSDYYKKVNKEVNPRMSQHTISRVSRLYQREGEPNRSHPFEYTMCGALSGPSS